LRLFQPKTSGIKRGLRSSGVEIESLIDVGEDMEQNVVNKLRLGSSVSVLATKWGKND
jgi:hypothetical protein